MREHAAYWRELANKRTAVIFGPIADPKGAWGLAVVEAQDEAAARGLGANDPTIKAGVGFTFEIYSMPQVVLRG